MNRLTRFLTGFSVLLSVVGVWGFAIEPSLLVMHEEKIGRWPGPPLRIAFFSDLHAGAPHIDESYVTKLVDRVVDSAPDLILIGGDFTINGVMGGKPIPIEKVAKHLSRLKARLGVYAVLGNHDWWNDAASVREALEEQRIQVLENRAKLIRLETGFEFWLAGIGDDHTKHADASRVFAEMRAPSAVAESKNSAPVILFTHDPAAFLLMKERFFLGLAGHMHGGQVSLPGLGALITPGRAPKRWARGRIDRDMGTIFVSRGIGTSIIPVRINSPPEFALLELDK